MRPHLPLLQRNERWVVAAKPPRVMVHRSSEYTPDRYFALQLVRDAVGQHVWPVHRLDRPASGCLLFALTKEWARTLQAAMSSEDAVKTYVAFTRGTWVHEGEVIVDTPMKDDRKRLKDARTTVWCAGTSQQPRCSLLVARPHTGRYHQVRRHVRDLHMPVLGDSNHGDTRLNRMWREEWGLSRLGLHCLSLDLPLPGGERLEVRCPPPADLRDIWRRMPWWEDAVRALPALEEPDPWTSAP